MAVRLMMYGNLVVIACVLLAGTACGSASIAGLDTSRDGVPIGVPSVPGFLDPPLTANQFDPALGTLEQMTAVLTIPPDDGGDDEDVLWYSITWWNSTGGPITETFTVTTTVTLWGPNSLVLAQFDRTQSSTVTVPAGEMFTLIGGILGETTALDNPSAADFIGTGTVQLDVESTVEWSHPEYYASYMVASAYRLSQITLTYDYTPAPPPDLSAPTPDPMTFASPPEAASETSITMTAATATDPSGVEYYFECTTGAGHDSGWQDSPTYADSGLAPGTTYAYRVRARDKAAAQNSTGWSEIESATTEGEDPDGGGSGCSVNARGGGAGTLVLLAPCALLLALRRRKALHRAPRRTEPLR